MLHKQNIGVYKSLLIIAVLIFAGIYFFDTRTPDFPDTSIPSEIGDIVINAADLSSSNIVGTRWLLVDDATASLGKVLTNPNNDEAIVGTALASPASYVEYTFDALANTPYHLWIRMKAEGDSYYNDSVHIQFSDSLNSLGAADYRIGTDKSLNIILEEAANANLSGWGWTDNGYGTFGTHIMFESSGTHTVRIQQRQDGVSIDEIVLSPKQFLTLSPGTFKDDANFVLKPYPTPYITPYVTPYPTPYPTPSPTSTPTLIQSPSIPPELPRIYLNTAYPNLSASRTLRYVEPTCGVTSNCYTNLQTAIDEALLGDEIIVRAGMSITGPIILKNKTTGNGWIVIRTSNINNLPPAGSRISPTNVQNMPKILAPGGNAPALKTENNAHHYRIVGIEFAEKIPNDDANVLVELGNANSQCATSTEPYKVCDPSVLETYSHDIILDRVYVHGSPTHNTKRGIGLDNKSSAIVDSYISDVHVVGQDAQAIAGINGPGPYKIVNNYIEGAAENLIFGGDDPRVQNLIPSDIEIRRNHFYKPLSWRYGDPTFNGRRWAVKNLFELKNAQRVIIDGNIFENNWAEAQSGVAILFNTTNQEGRCSWCAVMDITFSNNIVRHTGAGISIQANDYRFPQSTGRSQRIKIYNNLFEDLDGAKWKDLRTNQNAASYLFFLASGANEAGPDDVEISHNTAFHTGTVVSVDKPNPSGGYFTKARFAYVNNIAKHNSYGILGDSTGVGNSTIVAYFPGALFTKNILVGGAANSYSSSPGNYFPADWTSVFVNQTSGDYNILSSGIYNNAGTDGKNIGADIGAINAATTGVKK